MCAAGLEGSTADDVAKEVAIYRAHKASPIVVAIGRPGSLRGRPARDLGAARRILGSPSCSPPWPVTSSATRPRSPSTPRPAPLREARAAIEEAVGERAPPTATGCCGRCSLTSRPRRPASSTGCAAAPTTATSRPARPCASPRQLSLRARHRAPRRLPGRARPHRHARGGRRRPHRGADAGHRGAHPSGRRHQAPGQDGHGRASRAATRPCSSRRSCRPCWPPAPHATGSATRRCARWPTSIPPWPRSPVGSATSSTAIRRSGEVPVSIVDRGGIALDIPSRTERSGVLRGTKHTVALERQVFVTRGREDGRTVVIVPETKDDRAIGLTLLHVRFQERLPVSAARGALQGYRNRWSALRDAVLETEPTFREDLLPEVPDGRPPRGAHPRARRPLAQPGMIGIGVDLCEVDRMRTALDRTPTLPGARVHRRRAGLLRPPEGPDRALRRPLRRQGGGDEGDGGRGRRLQVAGDRGGQGPLRRAVGPPPRRRAGAGRRARHPAAGASRSPTPIASPKPSPSRCDPRSSRPEEMAAVDAGGAGSAGRRSLDRSGGRGRRARGPRPARRRLRAAGRRARRQGEQRRRRSRRGRVRLRRAGARVAGRRRRRRARRGCPTADLVVDAAYGTGFRRRAHRARRRVARRCSPSTSRAASTA